MPTGLLDDFNRADQTSGLLGTDWNVNINAGTHTNHDILVNQCKADAGAFSSNWWTTRFGVDQEASAIIVATPTTGSFRLYARLGDPGTTRAFGYELEITATDSFISKAIAPSFTRTSLLTLGVMFGSGNKARLRCVGTTISAWRDTGSGYTQVGSVTDTAIPTDGYIGIWTENNAVTVIDDFTGGDFQAGISYTAKR